MPDCQDELLRMTATQAVVRLKRKDISPLELIDAAERRIAAVEPAINALPTLCLDRARHHARRLMLGEGRDAQGEAGWLAGLPLAIKDTAAVAGVRTTYGSLIFKDHIPTTSTPWWSASSAWAVLSLPSRTRPSSLLEGQRSTRCLDAPATPGIPP